VLKEKSALGSRVAILGWLAVALLEFSKGAVWRFGWLAGRTGSWGQLSAELLVPLEFQRSSKGSCMTFYQ
jgi:hypothetical protein